jgi:hypothetical protein
MIKGVYFATGLKKGESRGQNNVTLKLKQEVSLFAAD